jgi:alpha-glucosidase
MIRGVQFWKSVLWIALATALVSHASAETHAVQSPDGQVSASFAVKNGVLFCSVSKDWKPVVAPSRIEIFADAKMVILGQSVRESDTSWKPVWGPFSTIRDHHRELTLSLTADGVPVTLLCRVFDTGVGFRFELSEESNGKPIKFSNGWNMVGDVQCFSPEGEVGVTGPVSLDRLEKIQVPLIMEASGGPTVAVMESDLFSADGFETVKIRYDAETKGAHCVSTAVSLGEGHVTPWRVLLLGDTMGDFLENTVVLNLAAPCTLDDVSWIQPGNGIWDYRFRGYDNGQFEYGVDEQSLLHLIDFAAKQGLGWLNVDAGWSKRQAELEAVFVHAEEKGIKLMLYYDRKNSVLIEDEELFKIYADRGASGIKYGFMKDDAAFTRKAIRLAAENRLLINFHDGPCPMAGVERTMPNLITREYCHAQQDCLRAFTPETFIKMAMVNALVGPLDQANGNFGIKSINAGERKKAPTIRDSYISTVVSEVARTLISYSGLIFLPDAPEEYLKKPDLFEVLKAMPATWDETRVLQAEFGKVLSMARRSGEGWFVGSVNDQTARTVDISLDFLEAGLVYEATICQDAPDAQGIENPEAYEIKKIIVKRGDTIQAGMAVGGGYCMRIRPVQSE